MSSPLVTLVLGGARSGKSAWAEDLAAQLSAASARPVLYVATARPLGWATRQTSTSGTAAPTTGQGTAELIHGSQASAREIDNPDANSSALDATLGVDTASSADPAANFDPDFTRRIALHQQRRPQTWITEDQRDVVDVLRTPPTDVGAILVDDLGTWLTAQMDAEGFFDIEDSTHSPDIEAALRRRFDALEDAVRNFSALSAPRSEESATSEGIRPHGENPTAERIPAHGENLAFGADPASVRNPAHGENPASVGNPPLDETAAHGHNPRATTPPLVIVTPEVGMGVIPAHPAGRQFRDFLGELNARVARHATRVVFVVAGCSLELTPPRSTSHLQ